MEGLSQMSSFAYIMMQDRLSTGGSFILCDGNARGFPISYASPGFVSLFGYPAVECVGVKCGSLVAGPSIQTNDPGLSRTARDYMVAPEAVRSGIALMTQYTGDECRQIMHNPSDKRDISHDIPVQRLLLAATSRNSYLELISARQVAVHERIRHLGQRRGMCSSNALQYLHEKACESWRYLMASDFRNVEKTVSDLPSMISTTAGSEDSESVAESESYESRSLFEAGDTTATLRSLIGTWCGNVSPTLGGYEQTMQFREDGLVRVVVYGKTLTGAFSVSADQEPKRLTLRLPSQVEGTPPPPAVTCILRFVDSDKMHFCLPWPNFEVPEEFDGPGFCTMVRQRLPVTAEEVLAVDDVLVNEVKGWNLQTTQRSELSTEVPESEVKAWTMQVTSSDVSESMAEGEEELRHAMAASADADLARPQVVKLGMLATLPLCGDACGAVWGQAAAVVGGATLVAAASLLLLARRRHTATAL